jgi:2-hydroxychromene-2-carboxylate isomerase
MAEPIRFYFDFASPYAYFALDGVDRLAARHGRSVDWRPVLVWAVLKAHRIAPPLDALAKRSYFRIDMPRSAAFYGVEYRHPETLPLSSHRAARLYYALMEREPERARRYGREVFAAFFARGEDISDERELVRIAGRSGVDAQAAREGMNGDIGRRRLAAAVDSAVTDNVTGSPFFIVDGEPFFGADRLPQIDWRLSQSRTI